MAEETPDEWTSEKSVANVIACNRPTRDESDSFSPDILTPTVASAPGTGNLAEAIKQIHHAPVHHGSAASVAKALKGHN